MRIHFEFAELNNNKYKERKSMIVINIGKLNISDKAVAMIAMAIIIIAII